MDLEPLVHRAQARDVKAFVELTRGYQHLAFGSALALVHDLQQAEDVVRSKGFFDASRARARRSLENPRSSREEFLVDGGRCRQAAAATPMRVQPVRSEGD
jgi:hypothetical protein